MKTLLRIAICGLLVPITVSANESSLFTADDVFELEYANDPRISPDGSRVVYERRSNDIMTDQTRSNIWMIGVDAEGHRPLVSGTASASSPRWSPDGERIAYLQSTDTGNAIFVRWLDSGQTALVSNLQQSPSNLSWSPDGRWLAFTSSVPSDKTSIAKARKKPEGAEWSEPVIVIDSPRYRWDGRGFLEPAYMHIFVVPADGGTPRQITAGDFDHGGSLSWTPDSQSIVFSADRSEGWQLQSGESDIWRISVGNGELVQVTNRQGSESTPVVSPDGRRIAYVSDANKPVSFNPEVLHVMTIDGENDQALTTELDRAVSGIAWRDNRNIYFSYDDRGVRNVGSTDLNGNVENVVVGLGSTSLGRPYTSGSFTVASNGTVAYTLGDAYRPADVGISNRRGARVLTGLNEDLLGNKTLGTVSEITYASSFDGVEIQGWYITPPDYEPGGSYPLILEIHGGPHLSYGPFFSAELQLMAAAGYVVFYDNHRGSTGYGEEFAMLLHYKYSSPEDFADHMSGIDALIDRGIADPENLFVTGGSAGGIATAYAVGLTDRFRAAAAAKPVVNWISKTLTADSYIGQIFHQFPGMPWEEYEHYWERSPLSLVGNMVTPTLIITGDEDYRTPMSETEQLYQALTLKGVDTVMVRVPGSSHGIAGRPSRLIAKVDNVLAWFARYRSDGNASD